MQPLRIAMLVKALPCHRPGGQENHAWALARGLATEGHHVTVVTSSHAELAEHRTEDGVEVVHLRGTAPGRNSWGFFRAVAKWVRAFDGDYDVFHSQGFAAMFARPKTTPLVTTVHGTVWSETPLARQVRPLLSMREKVASLWRFKGRTLLGPLAHRLWRRSTRLICDSEFTRSELLHFDSTLAPKVSVVPLGIDLPTEMPERAFSARPLRMLSVGRLERVRGLDDLLESLHSLESKDWLLRIVGDGPHRGSLEATIARLGLSARVQILGRLDDHALTREWQSAELFVNAEWSQPAFGLATLEALSWGLPVLSTRTGATPEILTEETGWLVNARMPHELILREIFAAPDLLRAKAAKARARAAQFSIEKMVAGTLSAYRLASGRL